MRVDTRRSRRLPPLLRLALTLQLLIVAAGPLCLLLAPRWTVAWLLGLLLASSLNLILVVFRPCRQSGDEPGRDTPPGGGAGGHRQREGDDQAPGQALVAREERLRLHLQGLEDDLAQRERRLSRLEAGRDRAREESRLKSDYLTLMGRELQRLQARIDELMVPEGEAASTHAYRQATRELHERVADLRELLEGLAGEGEAAAVAAPVRQGRVLIVDDGPVNLMLARQVLERQGLEVHTATSGHEALKALEQGPFALVLMDIFMPGMDGMETSRRWREQEARTYPGRRSVLVALTANASDEDRRRFAEAGLDDFLAKPYRPQTLVERVSRWLPERFEDADSS
ncbi:response regulator [Halomonas ramblicola]|uniref:response regulator n=1 Tax=Halomonas ramblicola TaxID=747349 RepID=UPI0025B3EE28|nr:response regulator [Halomonas ramblicola]MDN3523213.1 response regulator [Halomonas ramblicola]